MKGNTLLITIVVGLLGLVVGFLVANSINRSELSVLRAENERSKSGATGGGGAGADTKGTLTPEEIAATLAKADDRPDDLQTQRNVGIAIYRYAAMKEDSKLLRQAIRILDRALALKPDDYDVVLTLGNANFDVGYIEKSNEPLVRSREFYSKALAAKPNDPDVQTDLGLTYFLQTPQDLESSVSEFRKSLAADPKHEKTLQFLVEALAKQNKFTDAAQYLDQLKTVNPRNESIAKLSSMIQAQQSAG